MSESDNLEVTTQTFVNRSQRVTNQIYHQSEPSTQLTSTNSSIYHQSEPSTQLTSTNSSIPSQLQNENPINIDENDPLKSEAEGKVLEVKKTPIINWRSKKILGPLLILILTAVGIGVILSQIQEKGNYFLA